MSESLLFAIVFGAILLGILGERARAFSVAAKRRSKWRASGKSTSPARSRHSSPAALVQPWPNATDQLGVVMNAAFERRRLLSRKEAEIFHWAELAVTATGKPWRVMAQVCLGEILRCEDEAAFRAINSKRVDLLLVCNKSLPIAAIEYQGEGHHQGTASARDAVKKEALRRAGVRYIEVTPEHGPDDLAREVSRMIRVEQLKPAA